MVKALSLLYGNICWFEPTWGGKLVRDQQPFEPGKLEAESGMITLSGYLCASLHVGNAKRSRSVSNYRITVPGSPDLIHSFLYFFFRLPIVQGGTFTFLAPTFAILSLPHNKCPADFDVNGWGNISQENKTEQWQSRMQEVSE